MKFEKDLSCLRKKDTPIMESLFVRSKTSLRLKQRKATNITIKTLSKWRRTGSFRRQPWMVKWLMAVIHTQGVL
jgi:hypothetical protein